MSHIFISYSLKDIETTDQIVARLKERGFEVWIDREGIKGGNLWRVEIVEAIDSAGAFVLMLSPNSAASDNVRKEVDLAESSNRKIFPLLLAPVTLPPQLRYQLAGIQWIDYASNPAEKFDELVDVLYPHIADKFLRRVADEGAKAVEVENTREAEVVIGGLNLANFGVKEQEKLLNFIAEVTSTPRADLSFTNLTTGSVHAFIKMPAHSAYVLKTVALNQAKALRKYGIDAIRLDGDQNYVLLRTGQIAPLGTKPRSSWLARLLVGIIILAIVVTAGLIIIPPILLPIILPTPTPTHTLIPTATQISTVVPTQTPTVTYTPAPQVLFDFIVEADSAIWNSCESRGCDLFASGTPLKFGFPMPQDNGFATYATEYLEDGQAYRNFLYTYPKETPTGAVRGFYDVSAATIQAGDRFVATVGFLLDAKSVDGVIYRIYFLRGDTPPQDPIREVYDPILISEYPRPYSGHLDKWIVILPDSIVDQYGWFILEVDAGKLIEDDWSVWTEAYLERP